MVAKVLWMVARLLRFLGYPGWFLGCCSAVARVFGVVAMVLGWLLGCCYAVAKEPGLFARVLLCSC